MRPCSLACVGERAGGQAGKRTGAFYFVLFSFFDVVLFYIHILFVFFCTCGIIDLFAMIESFVLFCLFGFFCIVLINFSVCVWFELLRRQIYISTIFWVLFYDVFQKRALFVCT